MHTLHRFAVSKETGLIVCGGCLRIRSEDLLRRTCVPIAVADDKPVAASAARRDEAEPSG